MENSYLIIGAGCDIGVEFIKLLLNRKTNFIIATYRSEDSKKRLLDLIKDTEVNFDIVHLDFEVLSSLQNVLNDISYIKYVVDLAHNNLEELFASLKDKHIVDYYTANIINRAIFLKYIVRKMLTKRKGRLLYLSSTAVMYPNKGQSLYSSSKSAVENIYKSIGIEMGNRGITSVILRFGYINSGRALSFVQDKNDLLQDFLIEPSEVAKKVDFFLHDDGKCFNANEVVIDRGFFSSKRF